MTTCPYCQRYETKRQRLDYIICAAKSRRRSACGLQNVIVEQRHVARLERARDLFIRAVFRAQDAHQCEDVWYPPEYPTCWR